MRFNTFEVWIASNDVPLLEHATHPTELHGSKFISTYVESEAGQFFTVNWRDYGEAVMFCIAIRMDGVLVEKHASPPGITGRLQGVCSGGQSIRLFAFSSVNVLGPPYEQGTGRTCGDEDVGTIQVTFAPIRALKPVPACFSGPLCRIDGSFPKYMHCISVEDECVIHSGGLGVHSPTIPLMPSMDVELEDKDTVTFVFRYRPWMYLRTLGIVQNEAPAVTSGRGTIPDAHPAALLGTPALGKRSRSVFESDELNSTRP